MWGIMMRAKMGWWFKHRCQWGEGLEGGSLFKQPLRCAEKLTHFYPDPPLFVSIYCAVTFERLSLNWTRSVPNETDVQKTFTCCRSHCSHCSHCSYCSHCSHCSHCWHWPLHCSALLILTSLLLKKELLSAQLGERMLQCRWVFCFTVVTFYILTLL